MTKRKPQPKVPKYSARILVKMVIDVPLTKAKDLDAAVAAAKELVAKATVSSLTERAEYIDGGACLVGVQDDDIWREADL